jgi:hypothetical protein
MGKRKAAVFVADAAAKNSTYQDKLLNALRQFCIEQE